MQARLDRNPDKMRLGRQTVEHPFGTIKSWMGSTHFQTKTLKHVGTEMALHVLAYNTKRAMSILGVGAAPTPSTRVFTQPGPTTDMRERST